MYDMYPWNARADGPRTRPEAQANSAPRPEAQANSAPRPEAQANSAPRPEAQANSAPRDGNDPAEQDPDLDPATHAVQVALDRRDNGGDAADQTAAATARQ